MRTVTIVLGSYDVGPGLTDQEYDAWCNYADHHAPENYRIYSSTFKEGRGDSFSCDCRDYNSTWECLAEARRWVQSAWGDFCLTPEAWPTQE